MAWPQFHSGKITCPCFMLMAWLEKLKAWGGKKASLLESRVHERESDVCTHLQSSHSWDVGDGKRRPAHGGTRFHADRWKLREKGPACPEKWISGNPRACSRAFRCNRYQSRNHRLSPLPAQINARSWKTAWCRRKQENIPSGSPCQKLQKSLGLFLAIQSISGF